VHKLQFSTFIKSICYKRKKTAVYTLHVTAINHDGYIWASQAAKHDTKTESVIIAKQ